MRHLVTGGAGFIGSALVRRLVALGEEVRVFDDLSRGDMRRLPKSPQGWTLLEGDIRDRESVAKALNGCDIIWHLAYVGDTQRFYDNPKMVWDIGVNGIANVLDVCEHQGGKELFLVSSSETYQIQPEGMTPTPETVPLSVPDVLNPRASYGGGKIASELGALAYSMSGLLKRTVIMRPHNVTGPDMGTGHVIPQFAVRMRQLIEARTTVTYEGGGSVELATNSDDPLPFPIQGTGKETRSFIYIDDLIDAFLILYLKGEDRGIYHIGTMDERTIAQVAHEVADCFGRKINVVPGQLAAGSPPRRLPDISKIRALGFEPKVGFKEAVARTVEWYAVN